MLFFTYQLNYLDYFYIVNILLINKFYKKEILGMIFDWENYTTYVYVFKVLSKYYNNKILNKIIPMETFYIN